MVTFRGVKRSNGDPFTLLWLVMKTDKEWRRDGNTNVQYILIHWTQTNKHTSAAIDNWIALSVSASVGAKGKAPQIPLNYQSFLPSFLPCVLFSFVRVSVTLGEQRSYPESDTSYTLALCPHQNTYHIYIYIYNPKT